MTIEQSGGPAAKSAAATKDRCVSRNCRTAAYHVTTDAAGHVYIGDLVNQEIVEVDPEGKKLSSTKVAMVSTRWTSSSGFSLRR